MVKRILLPYSVWIIPRWAISIKGTYKTPANSLVYCLYSTNIWLKLKRQNHEYFSLLDKKTNVNHNKSVMAYMYTTKKTIKSRLKTKTIKVNSHSFCINNMPFNYILFSTAVSWKEGTQSKIIRTFLSFCFKLMWNPFLDWILQRNRTKLKLLQGLLRHKIQGKNHKQHKIKVAFYTL